MKSFLHHIQEPSGSMGQHPVQPQSQNVLGQTIGLDLLGSQGTTLSDTLNQEWFRQAFTAKGRYDGVQIMISDGNVTDGMTPEEIETFNRQVAQWVKDLALPEHAATVTQELEKLAMITENTTVGDVNITNRDRPLPSQPVEIFTEEEIERMTAEINRQLHELAEEERNRESIFKG